MVNLDAKGLVWVSLQRTRGMPSEGPKSVTIKLDFSASPAYSLDYTNQMDIGIIDLVQTLWVDNFANPAVLTVTVPTTQQVLQIPAGVQGYFPVLAPKPVRLIFSSTGGTVQQVALLNFPMYGA